MFVCGAIASTSAAWPITAPAESALEPGRADVDDDRHRRREEALDDRAHRGAEAARRVELDDERVVAAGLRPPHLILEVALADGVDVVVEHGDEDAMSRGRCGGPACKRKGHEQGREQKSPQMRQSHDGKDSIRVRSNPL